MSQVDKIAFLPLIIWFIFLIIILYWLVYTIFISIYISVFKIRILYFKWLILKSNIRIKKIYKYFLYVYKKYFYKSFFFKKKEKNISEKKKLFYVIKTYGYGE